MQRKLSKEFKMINTSFKIGDLVTNPRFCKYEPFRLEIKHFKGVTRRNQEWFDNLKACKNEKLTIEKLIEIINDRKKQSNLNIRSVTSLNCSSDYWTGYYDALGELLELIEDNK